MASETIEKPVKADTIEKPAKAAATVTVACKLPAGLVLRVGDMVERQEPVLGGGWRTVKEWRPRDQQIMVHGPARAPGQDPKAPIAGGYALTHGVPQEFWEQWLKENFDSPLVKNQQIFAHAKAEHASGMASEKKDIRSGLEPMNPDGDPRTPRPASPYLTPLAAMERA